MINTLVIVAVMLAIAVLISEVVKKRKPEPPTQKKWGVPEQLDRKDFPRPEAPWLVVAFTSETCDSCEAVVPKVEVLASHEVSTAILTFQDYKEIHERYGIDAVPTVVIADSLGVVRSNFVGPASAADLWAAVAELREPGSTPPPEAHTPIR
jgi:Thioredoxin